jgi:hypothetical protein
LEQVEQMRREVGNNSPDMIARLDAAESMIQVDLSKLKNDFPYINFEKTKFFWHGGIKAVSPIFSNIQGGTNKPNTLILVDNIEFGHYEKGEFELPNPPGFIDGVVSWNIAYSYKLDENTQKQDFSRMIETFIITPVGTMSSIKGNGSATATYEEKSSSIRDADLTNTP